MSYVTLPRTGLSLQDYVMLTAGTVGVLGNQLVATEVGI